MNNGFHDEAIQDKILSILSQHGVCISPYDGAFFRPKDLVTIRHCLQSIIDHGRDQPDEWPLAPHDLESYGKRMKVYHNMTKPPRHCMIMDCKKLLAAINAIESEEMDGISFIGD